MIPTADEYLNNNPPQINRDFAFAYVAGFDMDGNPLLRFSADGEVSSKVYPKIRAYDDVQVGDRVILAMSGNEGIILGSWT